MKRELFACGKTTNNIYVKVESIILSEREKRHELEGLLVDRRSPSPKRRSPSPKRRRHSRSRSREKRRSRHRHGSPKRHRSRSRERSRERKYRRWSYLNCYFYVFSLDSIFISMMIFTWMKRKIASFISFFLECKSVYVMGRNKRLLLTCLFLLLIKMFIAFTNTFFSTLSTDFEPCVFRCNEFVKVFQSEFG